MNCCAPYNNSFNFGNHWVTLQVKLKCFSYNHLSPSLRH